MKSLIILLLFFSFIKIYSQSTTPDYTQNIFLLPQGFGIEQLNSKGTSGILNNISNICSINPASIHQFQHLSFGLSYQFQSNIPGAYILDMNLSRVYNYLPQSIGAVFHLDKFCFGMGAGQRYNGNIEFGSILITTPEQPDGMGVIVSLRYKQMLGYYSLIGDYTFDNLILNKSEFTIGLKYNLNHFTEKTEMSTLAADIGMWGSNFEAGVHYKYNFDEERYLNLGFSFINRLEMKNNPESGIDTISGNGRGPAFYTIAEPSAIVKFPAQFNFDIIYQPLSAFKIAGTVKNVIWNEIQPNTKNQPEYSFSGIYSPVNSICTSLGIYHSNRSFINDLFGVTDEMEAFYITAGLSVDFQMVNVDIALADSHLFSGDRRKQTIGKIGLAIQF